MIFIQLNLEYYLMLVFLNNSVVNIDEILFITETEETYVSTIDILTTQYTLIAFKGGKELRLGLKPEEIYEIITKQLNKRQFDNKVINWISSKEE